MSARMKRRTVTANTGGKRYVLAPRTQAGLVPCTGEAHNPEVGGMIDNCSLCAPNWGEMMSYASTPISALTKGVAIAVSATGGIGSAAAKAFETAAKDLGAQMIMVTEKAKWGQSSFFAWVLP